MARPLRIQYKGAFYHVTCRGNKRKNVYLDDNDRIRFLKYLNESTEIYGVVLYAYVLMDNHYHILIQTKQANLSEFMRRFNICYTGWFNYYHKTIGHLYQGRYKAILVDADSYLLELSRYIHLNPVRTKKLMRVDVKTRYGYLYSYKWSSFIGYIDRKKQMDFVDYKMILNLIPGEIAYRNFVLDGLQKGIINPFDNIQYQTILGDGKFTACIKAKYIGEGSLRDQPSYREVMYDRIKPNTIIEIIASTFNIPIKTINQRRSNGKVRGITAELLYRFCGLNNRQIGQTLGGIDYGGVHQLRRRLKEQIDKSKILKQQYDQIVLKIEERCSK